MLMIRVGHSSKLIELRTICPQLKLNQFIQIMCKFCVTLLPIHSHG